MLDEMLFSDTETTAADIAKYLTDDLTPDEETSTPAPPKPATKQPTAADIVPEDEIEGEDESGEAEEQPEAEEVPTEVKPAEPAKPEPPKGITFTPAQTALVNTIVAERLARDGKRQEAAKLEALTGKTLAELAAEHRKTLVAELADRTGLTEAEAKEHFETQEKVRLLEAQEVYRRQERAALQNQMAYQQARTKHVNDPLAQRYAADVDALTKGGMVLDYEAGLRYVLGDKLVAGDLRDFLKTSTEQQTLANVEKRAKVKVEGGGQAVRAPEARLEGTEKRFAHILLGDLTDKPEAAYNQAKRK